MRPRTPTASPLRWAIWLAASLGAPVSATDNYRLSELDFFGDLPRVLSASRLEQAMADAPVAIEVIDRETIAASGALDVPELLRLVPGFQVTDIDGTQSIATYHGFSGAFARRMQVMVDGRSIYEPGANGVLWAALPITLDQIERIEVVRGSNAATYGSNAVLGSVNIVTRHSGDDPGPKLVLLGGSQETGRATLQYGGRRDAWSYRVATSGRRSEGFDQRLDGHQAEFFTLRADHHPLGPDSLSLQLGFRNTEFDSELFPIPRQRRYRSHYQHLVWNRSLDSGSALRLQLYHNYFASQDAQAAVFDLGLRSHRYDLELQHLWTPGRDWRISWGAGTRRDTARGPGIFDTAATIDRSQLRAFANVEWLVSQRWILNGGLMIENFSDNGTFFSPRLVANWKPAPEHSFRLGAARGYRMPTLLEQRAEVKLQDGTDLFLQQIRNPAGIEAEQVASFELAYLRKLPGWRGHLDLRLYQDNLENVILDVRNAALVASLGDPRTIPGDTRVFSDVGKLKVRGIELQTDLTPRDGTRLQLAYAYADSPTIYRRDIDPPLLRSTADAVPKHTASLLVMQDLPHAWQISALWHYVSDMAWLDEGDELSAHHRTDARVSKRLRLAGAELRLSVIVHNLFNQAYWEFQEPGSRFFGNRNDRQIYAEIALQPY